MELLGRKKLFYWRFNPGAADRHLCFRRQHRKSKANDGGGDEGGGGEGEGGRETEEVHECLYDIVKVLDPIPSYEGQYVLFVTLSFDNLEVKGILRSILISKYESILKFSL